MLLFKSWSTHKYKLDVETHNRDSMTTPGVISNYSRSAASFLGATS